MFEQEINLSDHYGMIVPPKLVNDTYPSIHTRRDCGGRQNSNRYCRSISGRSSVLISSRGRRHRWKKFTHFCHLDNQADGRGYIFFVIYEFRLWGSPRTVKILSPEYLTYFALRIFSAMRMWWTWALVRHTRP